ARAHVLKQCVEPLISTGAVVGGHLGEIELESRFDHARLGTPRTTRRLPSHGVHALVLDVQAHHSSLPGESTFLPSRRSLATSAGREVQVMLEVLSACQRVVTTLSRV